MAALLTCSRHVGVGTTFTITLPAIKLNEELDGLSEQQQQHEF